MRHLIYSLLYPFLKQLPKSEVWGRKVAFHVFLSPKARLKGYDAFCLFLDENEKRQF